ncbi:homoserine dehydrogenase [Agaribacterium sp. ZY112]|uniref:homoserine dehydrogenase n=1 Tax=Agaribacterium sp. ZY112 TaxID=3233574 RepID=UPI003526274B
MKRINIGICGLGTVGGGTFNVLKDNSTEINARARCEIAITHVGARRDNPECNLSETTVSRDIFSVVEDKDIDVVVELIGGTTVAKDLVLKAVQNGKHVVTANKALIAEFGNELFAEAARHNVSISYEAAVAGGIPIISALRDGLSANKIEWLAGIINGTGNFILTEMRDKGRDFADVLAEAQELGYAEADPTFDVEGIDAAHKLVILASLAYGMPLQYDKVFCEGISKIEPADVEYANELGYRIKHLGIAKYVEGKGIELRVHPTLIPESRLIANVDGVMNSVLVKGNAVGPTLFYGAGAGALPTASAVVSDVVRVARQLASGAGIEGMTPSLGFDDTALKDFEILPIEEAETAFYLRLPVVDEPGALSKIAQILSDAGISIEALIQKEPAEGENSVPVIMLTSRVQEKNMIAAAAEIENLSTVAGPLTRIRVESLK